MRNKLFLVFLIALLCVGISLFIKPQKDVSYLERAGLSGTSELMGTSFIEGSFQETVEEILIDQLYFKDNMIQLYYRLKIAASSFFDQGYIKLAEDVIKIDDFYIRNLVEENEEDLITTANRGYNIKLISEAYPDVSVYVYKPTRLEETNLLDSRWVYSQGYVYDYEFEGQLGDNVTYRSLSIESVEQFDDYFYDTDIHWTPYGAYQGYTDIIMMLNETFDLGDAKSIESEVCYEERFYGSLANKIGQTTEAEAICDITLSGIGEYSYSENGQDISIDAVKQGYILNDYDSLYSDYDNYFGDNPYERIFDFGENTGVNALFFVDSFINVNKVWLASHFDTTIMLDMRTVPDVDTFDLDDYMGTYEIDVIIVSMYYENLYVNGYNFIPLND